MLPGASWVTRRAAEAAVAHLFMMQSRSSDRAAQSLPNSPVMRAASRSPEDFFTLQPDRQQSAVDAPLAVATTTHSSLCTTASLSTKGGWAMVAGTMSMGGTQNGPPSTI